MNSLVKERKINVSIRPHKEIKSLSLKEIADNFLSGKIIEDENGHPLYFRDILMNIGVFKKDPTDENIKKRAVYLALLIKDNMPSDNLLHAIGTYVIVKMEE